MRESVTTIVNDQLLLRRIALPIIKALLGEWLIIAYPGQISEAVDRQGRVERVDDLADRIRAAWKEESQPAQQN